MTLNVMESGLQHAERAVSGATCSGVPTRARSRWQRRRGRLATRRAGRLLGVAVAFFACVGLVACGGAGGEVGDSGADDMDETGGGTEGGLPAGGLTSVDLLLIVDNSGSMATEQRVLASVVPPMVQRLSDQGLDVRVGVTTTDAGNSPMVCPEYGENATSSEFGALRASSCTSRPIEFEWPHSGPIVEAYEATCLSVCPEATGSAWSITPTSIVEGGEVMPRPWVEVHPDGSSNVEGTSWAAALRCMVPQGVDGCGFESQLESQRLAVSKSADPNEPHFGFLREDAMLAVVHLTDEADCSMNPDLYLYVTETSSFNPELFYNGPNPTSAICWNAGTSCVGDGAPFEACNVANYNYLGQPLSGAFDEDASDIDQQVLLPLSRFQSQLDALPHAPVVAMFAGVPSGYAEGASDIVYTAAAEGSETWTTNGIEFGCTAEVDGVEQNGVPPVRLRDFAAANHPQAVADATGLPRNIFSICDSDTSEESDRIVDLILAGVAQTNTNGG